MSKYSDLVDKVSERVLHPEREYATRRRKVGIPLLSVAIAFLLIGLFGDPDYDFYTLLRFCIFSIVLYFGFLEHRCLKCRTSEWIFVWLVIAILFNPLLPITFKDRDIWSLINVVMIGLFAWKIRLLYIKRDAYL